MFRMIRFASLSLAILAGCATAQYAAPAASYGAPAVSSGYAAPDAGYGAPTGGASYAAPSTGYEAAAPAYDYAPAAAGGYAAPAPSYAAAPSGFDFSSLASFIIPALVVIGLIIAAVIIGGGLLALLGSNTTLSLAGLAPLINALLNPLGLSLCTTNPLAIYNGFIGRESARMLADLASDYGFDFSESQMSVVVDFAQTAYEAVKSKY